MSGNALGMARLDWLRCYGSSIFSDAPEKSHGCGIETGAGGATTRGGGGIGRLLLVALVKDFASGAEALGVARGAAGIRIFGNVPYPVDWSMSLPKTLSRTEALARCISADSSGDHPERLRSCLMV